MNRTMVVATMVSSLCMLSAGGALADGKRMGSPHHLQHLVIENADTAEEHEALARYYAMEAAEARATAKQHRTMAESYQAHPARRRQMKKHCERIAELSDRMATEYESLATGEEAAAEAAREKSPAEK